jgi:hypothetical protein
LEGEKIYNIMKKATIYLALLMAGAAGTCQIIPEVEIGSGAVKGEKIFIRTSIDQNDTIVVMYNYDYNLVTGENRFTVRNLNTNATVSFKIPDVYSMGGTPFPQPPNPNSGQILYRIHDMKIWDGICYFCGEERTTTGNFIGDTNGQMTFETTDVGIVGYFSIADVLSNSPNANIVYTHINSTKSLKRMAVSNNSITLIGNPYTPSYTCIVDLYPTISGWKYDAAHPINSEEHLTDITTVHGFVATVSRMVYNNYGFIIRYSNASRILNNPASTINTPHVFSTQTASMVSFPDQLPTYRYEYDPLYLCAHERDSGLFVAHACKNNHFGTAVYRMKIPVPCDSLKNIANQYSMAYSYTALKDLKYSNNDKTLYFLTEKGGSTDVRLASFTNTADYSDFLFSHTDKNYQSFDTLNGPKLAIGGRYTNTTSIFQSCFKLFHNVPPFVFPVTECNPFYLHQVFMLKPIAENQDWDEMNTSEKGKSVSWENLQIQITSLSNTTICP